MPWPFLRKSRAEQRKPAPHQKGAGSGEAQGGEGQRRYLSDVPYMLPKDLGEVNRLDFQHYALRAVLRRNYLAPIRAPHSLLDVGCGTGRWAFDLCQEFPEATVIGFDLEQVRASSVPLNYHFVQGNLLEGLPFAENSFDFVHQRFLWLAVPLNAWASLVQSLARVTAPGGWVELVEFGTEMTPAGPATQRHFQLAGQLVGLRGLDGQGVVARSLDHYLRQAGLVHVERHVIDIPIGDWGGRAGALLAIDCREASLALSAPIAAHLNITPEAYAAQVEAMLREFNEYHTSYRLSIAYGQKP